MTIEYGIEEGVFAPNYDIDENELEDVEVYVTAKKTSFIRIEYVPSIEENTDDTGMEVIEEPEEVQEFI